MQHVHYVLVMPGHLAVSSSAPNRPAAETFYLYLTPAVCSGLRSLRRKNKPSYVAAWRSILRITGPSRTHAHTVGKKLVLMQVSRSMTDGVTHRGRI